MHSYKHSFINTFLSIFEKMIKRPLLSIIILFVSVSVFMFFFPILLKDGKDNGPSVRVRILNNEKSINLILGKQFEIVDPITKTAVTDADFLRGVVDLTFDPEGLLVNGHFLKIGKIRILPSQNKDVIVNKVPYRGYVDIINDGEGLSVINTLSIEDYLKGVVPCEVNPYWPFSMLKAQAIASRSFAAYQLLKRKNKSYDLTSDTFSQVYRGRLKENGRTTKAVRDTRGKVLVYKGKVLAGYFHSCCGGHTENASKIWNHDLEPFKGVKCKWCRWSRHYKWKTRISKDEILEKLMKKGYNVKNITAIKEGKRNSSGRLEGVIVYDGNNKYEIDAESFRAIIGRGALKSANFRIGKFLGRFTFKGLGWGHGVGMCQWGGFGLAVRWKSAEKILKYYYPGAAIESLEKVFERIKD